MELITCVSTVSSFDRDYSYELCRIDKNIKCFFIIAFCLRMGNNLNNNNRP